MCKQCGETQKTRKSIQNASTRARRRHAPTRRYDMEIDDDGGCGLNFCDDWSDGEDWAVTSTRGKRVGMTTTPRAILEDGDAWYELTLPPFPPSRGRTAGDDDAPPSPSTSSSPMPVATPTTLRVSQVKGQGELGTVVWNAALVLCATLRELSNDVVRGRRVLEIGAGCGACGFYAAALGAAETTIADCGPKTMLNLRRTLREYARLCRMSSSSSSDDDDDDEASKDYATKQEDEDLSWDTDAIHLRRHLWEEDSELLDARIAGTDPRRVRHWSNAGGALAETSDGSPPTGFAPTLAADAVFDVIIGSDLLYFSSQESSLLAALRLRLHPRSGVCVLVQTLRGNNAQVFSRFITDARRYFRVDVVSVPIPTGFNLAKETPHTLSVDPYRLVTLHPL